MDSEVLIWSTWTYQVKRFLIINTSNLKYNLQITVLYKIGILGLSLNSYDILSFDLIYKKPISFKPSWSVINKPHILSFND